MSDLIASARNMSVIAEGQYNTVGMPAGGLTPATLTAMMGMVQGNGAALDIAPKVKTAMTNLQTTASSMVYPANVQAAAALASLTSIQGQLFNKDDCGGFGQIVGKVQTHINDSRDLLNTTDFLSNSKWGDFGSGISNLGSMVDRGLPNVLGSLPAAGAAMAATGSMFNGVDVKDFGSPLGLLKSLQFNKLANATGVTAKLAEAGVPLDDIDNPIYADKISQVMSNIKDTAAINVTADQFGITNPLGGLPSYNGNDSSLYSTPSFLGGVSTNTSNFVEGSITQGASTASSTIGASLAATVPTGGGIQSLKDLCDPSKLAPAGSLSGFSGVESLTRKFKDLGAGSIVDASAATSFFSKIQTTATPLLDQANSTLKSLADEAKTMAQGLIGGSKIPTAQDLLGPVGGMPELDALAEGVSIDKISALTSKLSATSSFLSAADITAVTAPATQTLGKVMTFATALPKYGKDMSEGSIGNMLKNMANSATKYGEAVKASLIEGANNNLLSANGIVPPVTNPLAGVPSYSGTDSSLVTNAGAKMLGG